MRLDSVDCEGTGGIEGHVSESCTQVGSLKGATRAALLCSVCISLADCMYCKRPAHLRYYLSLIQAMLMLMRSCALPNSCCKGSFLNSSCKHSEISCKSQGVALTRLV